MIWIFWSLEGILLVVIFSNLLGHEGKRRIKDSREERFEKGDTLGHGHVSLMLGSWTPCPSNKK